MNDPAPLAVEFQLLFDSLLIPHLALTPELQVVAVTDSLCRAVAQPREALLHRSFYEVLPTSPTPKPAQLLAEWEQAFAWVRQEQRTRTMPVQHYRVVRPNGRVETHQWQIIIRPIVDAAHELRYLLCRAEDVTARLRAEQRSLLSRDDYALLNQTTHDAVWDANLVTGEVRRNEAFNDLLGFAPDVPLHTHMFWQELVHPDDRERVWAHFRRVLAPPSRELLVSNAYRLRRADGTWAEVVDRAHVVRNAEGEAVRLLGAVQDVTHQHQMQRAAQLSAARFQTLAEAQHQIVWTARPDGEVEYVNPYWTTYTGCFLQEATAVDWATLLHPDDLSVVQEHYSAAMHAQTPYEQEFRLREAATGTYRWFLARATPLRGPEGQVQQWVGAAIDVHDLKTLQQQLRHSTEQLQMLLGMLPQLIWQTDAEGQPTYFNQRWCSYTGDVGPTVQPANWLSLLHPDDQPATTTRWQQALRTGENYQAEFRLQAADGHYRWFLAQARPLRDTQGQVTQWFGTCTDIDAAKQVQQQLEEKDLHLRRILKEVPANIATVTGPTHVYTFVNDTFQHMLGGRAQLGRTVAETLPEVDRQGVLAILDRVYTTGQPYVGQESKMKLLNVATQQEEVHYFDFTYQPLQDEHQRTQGVLLFAVDVTERVQTRLCAAELHDQVRRSDERFRFLADAIPAMVWTATPDGFVEYQNRRFYEYTGLPAAEAGSSNAWWQHLHPHDWETTERAWQHSLRTGAPYEVEHRLRSAQGQYRWMLVRAWPMRDEATGAILKWFGSSTDVHDAKLTQQRLEQQNAELLRTNQDLDNFVYTASHDLRQPIHNMEGIFTELTRTAYFADPDAAQLVTMFDRALQQIYDTIHDLSALVQIQQHQQELPIEPIDLHELIRGVLDSMQDQVTETGAQITLELAVPTLAFVRPNLHSLVYNLLSNALKYVVPGRPPHVRLQTATEANYVVLTVQDNGLGIDLQQYGSEIFRRFRRFHHHVPGSGIGLYLVNRIVQSAGGHLQLQSTVGEGTTVQVYLPLEVSPTPLA